MTLRKLRPLKTDTKAVEAPSVNSDLKLIQFCRRQRFKIDTPRSLKIAGTTDFGSIDPLPAVAELAAKEKIWLHVDAAYGGALVFSARHRALLDGIGRADSVTIDFHKMFFQPISCSALLVRDNAPWEVIRYHVDYLDPEKMQTAACSTWSPSRSRPRAVSTV